MDLDIKNQDCAAQKPVRPSFLDHLLFKRELMQRMFVFLFLLIIGLLPSASFSDITDSDISADKNISLIELI